MQFHYNKENQVDSRQINMHQFFVPLVCMYIYAYTHTRMHLHMQHHLKSNLEGNRKHFLHCSCHHMCTSRVLCQKVDFCGYTQSDYVLLALNIIPVCCLTCQGMQLKGEFSDQLFVPDKNRVSLTSFTSACIHT